MISTSSPSFDTLASGTDEVSFFAKAVYHGPSQNGKLEVEPWGNKPTLMNRLKSKLGPGKSMVVNALRLLNASTVVSMLDNFAYLDSEETAPLPILPLLLGDFETGSNGSMQVTKPAKTIRYAQKGAVSDNNFPLKFNAALLCELIEAVISEHNLNADQAAVPLYPLFSSHLTLSSLLR